MTDRQGPAVRLEASCSGCAYERSESYAVQGDSGFNVSCAHPEFPSSRHIGDTTWRTPDWCPLLVVATEALIRNLSAAPAREPKGGVCCFEDCDQEQFQSTGYCSGHLESELRLAAKEAGK